MERFSVEWKLFSSLQSLLFMWNVWIGVQAKQKDNTTDQPKLKKSQRNYPVYYVNTKVNGQFGRGMSVRSLNIDKFENVPLITV